MEEEILQEMEEEILQENVIDFVKNDLIDNLLIRYYQTYNITCDTGNFVPEKDNKFIRNYIFKNLKKDLKNIEIYFKGYKFNKETDTNSYFNFVKENSFWKLLKKKIDRFNKSKKGE